MYDSNRPAQLHKRERESRDIADQETRPIILSRQRTTKALIRLCGGAG